MEESARITREELLEPQYSCNVIAQPDGGYVVVFPDLPGCLAQIERLAELPAAAAEVQRLWIEGELAAGRSVPEPTYREAYSGRFNVRIARSLHRRLADSATQEGVSLNQYVMTLLDRNDALARVERQVTALAAAPPAAASAPAAGSGGGTAVVSASAAPVAHGALSAFTLEQSGGRSPHLVRDLAQRTNLEDSMTAATHIPEGHTALTAYLCVHDAAAALDFYTQAFGARELSRLPWNGRIGHAEMEIGNARFMLSDEWPEGEVFSPRTLGHSSAALQLYVEDAEAVWQQAVALGATPIAPVAVQPYGNREGRLRDPFGYRWFIATHIEDVSNEDLISRIGDGTDPLSAADGAPDETSATGTRDHAVDLVPARPAYFTLAVHDVLQAQRFFGALLGWQFEQAPRADGSPSGHVTNTLFPFGLSPWSTRPAPAGEEPVARVWFGADDITTAIARVRAAGGRASEPQNSPSGVSADCFDDQGLPFGLHVPAPGFEDNGNAAAAPTGEPVQFVLSAPDINRAAGFAVAAFGWQEAPATADREWRAAGVTPTCVIRHNAAGPDMQVVFHALDLDQTLDRVHALGGAVVAVEAQGDQRVAICLDDQGMEFRLSE